MDDDIEDPQISRTALDANQSLFQVSQSYNTFEDEAQMQNWMDLAAADADSVVQQWGTDGALLQLPPLAQESVMLKGDNGVTRWAVFAASNASGEDEETESYAEAEHKRRRIESTKGGRAQSSVASVGIHALLEEYHRNFVANETKKQQIKSERESRQAAIRQTMHERTEDVVSQWSERSSEDDLWVSKYRPRSFKDLLSDETVNLQILQWMRQWHQYVFGAPNSATTRRAKPKKSVASLGKPSTPAEELAAMEGGNPDEPQRPAARILLVVGPPGIGKTTLAHVLAEQCGYEAREVNASSDRSISALDSIIIEAVANKGRSSASALSVLEDRSASDRVKRLLMLPKCLIVDEMDGIQANVVTLLLKKDIHRPVLCLANNLYAPALRDLRSHPMVSVIQVPSLLPQRLVSRLEVITQLEGLQVDKGTLSELVHTSNGDIRCCLNTLQFLRRNDDGSGGGSASASGRPKGNSAAELHRVMSELKGKDATLGLWPLWTDMFVKKERGKYASLLKSEHHFDFEAFVAAASESAGVSSRKRPRVDAGYVYMTKKLEMCADVDTLLDGAFQHYTQQRYPDYNLQKTAHCGEAFSFQDVLTAHSFQHQNFSLKEKFANITNATVFVCCSSLNRTTLQFPRETMEASERQRAAAEAARCFMGSLRGANAPSYSSCEGVSMDVAPLFTRCLMHAWIKFPSHQFSGIKALGPADQRLFQSAVERHVEYGISYAEQLDAEADAKSSKWRPPGQPEKSSRNSWGLSPSLHLLGGLRRYIAKPRRTGPADLPHAPPARNDNYFTVRNVTIASGFLSPQGTPIVMSMHDDVKQVLVGACSQESIRRRQEKLTATTLAANAGRERFPLPQLADSDAKTFVPKQTEMISASDSPAPVSASVAPQQSPKKPLKAVAKDFFGRPIAPKAAASTTKKLAPVKTVVKAEGGDSQASVVTPTKKVLPATHPVKYVFFDGSTNAVKMPATLADF